MAEKKAKPKSKSVKKIKVSSKTKINQSGSGSVATKKGIAAGAGGVAAQKVRDVTIINQAPREKPKPVAQPKTKTVPGSLPFGSNIPFPRNALFTGREADLDLIAESLLGKKPTTTLISQAITGMGGIGKTQLAVEFAYRYGYKFNGVHWLNLANPESLDSEIAACGRAMGLTYDDQREQVANTMKIWQSGGLRLLILDNFEEVDKASILARLQGSNIRMLITSRRNDWPKELGLNQHGLNLFSETESLDFLERSLDKKETKEERKTLADKLGYLPLALELAAKYININKISIADYLHELNEILSHESMGADWFKSLDIKTPTEHELSLFATFQLSWQEVKDEVQQNIFRIAGYCAPNTPIPVEIFAKTLELDEKVINKALYRLGILGLLNMASSLPSIHLLLAAFSRKSPKENIEILLSLEGTLGRLTYDALNSELPSQFVPFLPHTEAASSFIEDAFPEKAGRLLSHLGTYYEQIANFTRARDCFEHALKVDEAVFGPNNPNVATIANNLGAVLQDLNDLENAKLNYERALKIDEAALGPEHPSVARDISNLGGVLKDLGDLQGAKASFERTLKIDEAQFGHDHPSVALGLNNLGSILLALGDVKGARDSQERALKILKKFLPEGHPDIKLVESNLKVFEKLK